MPSIISIAEAAPAHVLKQDEVKEFARDMFFGSFRDVERLLRAFHNGQIEKRHFAKPLDWYREDKTFQEKNDAYLESAVELGAEAIETCLSNSEFLNDTVPFEHIDAIFTVSSSGLATPSIEARIMNVLPFSEQTKRIPIWGLGCAGGASGLSRAYEYCLAYPKAMVLLLSVELCSLTFQRNDFSKSNLIGTSLFADGVACVLLAGDDADISQYQKLEAVPYVKAVHSVTMKNSLEVMGWDVKDDGLHVIFSKDIPTIISGWMKPIADEFLHNNGLHLQDVSHFVAHPGGKKVIDAYEQSFGFASDMTAISLSVLKEFGNMSSATILYVLKRFMKIAKKDEIGLAAALGPGFSSEMLVLKWE